MVVKELSFTVEMVVASFGSVLMGFKRHDPFLLQSATGCLTRVCPKQGSLHFLLVPVLQYHNFPGNNCFCRACTVCIVALHPRNLTSSKIKVKNILCGMLA